MFLRRSLTKVRNALPGSSDSSLADGKANSNKANSSNSSVKFQANGKANGKAEGNGHAKRSSMSIISNKTPRSSSDTKSTSQAEREAVKKARAAERYEIERQRKENDEIAMREEAPEMRARYGKLPLILAKENRNVERPLMSSFSEEDVDKEVVFQARVHTVRKVSTRLVFFVFRQQIITMQGVLEEHAAHASAHMLKWAEHVPTESIVLVKGFIQHPREPVKGTTIHNIELSIRELHIISEPTESLPFTVYEDVLAKEDKKHPISDRERLLNRVLDLRTPQSLSIFRVNAGVCNAFRTYLDDRGFLEIHTPKLQGGATESGASVFQVNYFGRPAFLAQSPQLAKQMSIAADFGRVYEIGPVFRAENSNTHRHMTEYTGLDLEMQLKEHYHEALDLIDDMLKHVFKTVYAKYRTEIESIKAHFPHEDLQWLEQTPRIPFKEGVKMLRDSGWVDEDGHPPPDDEDLATRDEIQLGKLVKEKYGTDYFILDKFPASARPFYTMPDADDDNYTNSFDIFLRGQEILTGGQRIHDATVLEARMNKLGIQAHGMEEYLAGFRWGAPPHAGSGIGLERILMLLLNLGNIRLASLYPRDPKSLPERPKVMTLRHPEAGTCPPPWDGKPHTEADYQPIEKLIANFGDATNTSWLDERYQIWRHDDTGAAVGYVPSHGHAIIVGNPLCDKRQYKDVIPPFLRFVKKTLTLKPIWILVDKNVEYILGESMGWRTLSCVAEDRTDPNHNHAIKDQAVARKVRHAQHENVKITDIPAGKEVPLELREKVDKRIEDWHSKRKGRQAHITEIKPWVDMEHRRYFVATDREGTVVALVVLATLSAEHGFQVKWALDFPGAPSGTIEYSVLHAMDAAAAAGATSVTFGAGATGTFIAEHGFGKNGGGIRVKALEHSYHAIATELKLMNKSEFREKMGAREDPVYICYPKHGMGPRGIHAILHFLGTGDGV